MKALSKLQDIAILLCAGSSLRFKEKAGIKKQFYFYKGKPLFLYPLITLIKSNLFKEIILVIAKEDEKIVKDFLVKENLLKENVVIIYGSVTRHDSVKKALEYFIRRKKDFNVLIHDGARPFIKEKHLVKIMKTKKDYDAITYAIKVNDSLLMLKNKKIEYIPREDKYLVYTPQRFTFKTLKKMYEKDQEATDDFSLAVKLNMKCTILEGEKIMFKVTDKSDLSLIEEK